MDKLKIKKLYENSVTPTRATCGSAGFDLYAYCPESVTVNPNCTEKISVGIAVAIEENNLAGFIYARSGISTKYGVAPANCVGIIDSDYRGEVFVPLHNYSSEPFTVTDRMRIAQLVISPVLTPEIAICEELSDTERNTGGFGSSGL